MPSSDPNKAYIKKHKINDILNDLFKQFTEFKPENPIEFACRYFQDKLPPKVEVTEEESTDKSPPKIEVTEGRSNDLMAQLMAKQGMASLGNSDDKKTEAQKSSFALSNFQIMKKVDRILASNVIQETADDILNDENITCHSAGNGNDADDQVESSIKIIKYKNHLDKRDIQSRHREDLEKLLLKQIDRENKKKYEVGNEKRNETRDFEDDKYILMNEVAGNSVQAPREVESNTVKERVVRADSVDVSKRKSRFMSMASPQTPMIVCQVCQKLQGQSTVSDTLPKQSIDLLDKNKSDIASAINPKPTDDEKLKKLADAKNNIFDLLRLNDDTKLEDLAPMTKKDTTRTARTNDDDDFIESASQVSGPRGIESFEPATNRSNNGIVESKPKIEEPNKIMAWLMTKQQAEEAQLKKNVEETKEPSIAGSNTSNKTLRSTSSKAKSAATSKTGNQAWNMIGSSSSERSSVTRRNK